MINKTLIKLILIKAFYTKKYYISLLLIILSASLTAFLFNSIMIKENKCKKNYNVILSSNTYFTSKDIQNVKYIKNHVLNKSQELKVSVYSKEYKLRINNISAVTPNIKQGKLPTKVNEGIINISFAKKHKINISDIITIKDNNNIFKVKKIKIVGITQDSFYEEDALYVLNNCFNTKYNKIILKSNDINKSKYIKKEVIQILNNKYKKEIENLQEDIKKLEEKKLLLNNANIINDTKISLINKINNEIKQQNEKNKNLNKPKINLKTIYDSNNYKNEKNKIVALKITYVLVLLITIIINYIIAKKDISNSKKIINILKLLNHNKIRIIMSYLISYILRYTLITLVFLLLINKILLNIIISSNLILVLFLCLLSYIIPFYIFLKKT